MDFFQLTFFYAQISRLFFTKHLYSQNISNKLLLSKKKRKQHKKHYFRFCKIYFAKSKKIIFLQ